MSEVIPFDADASRTEAHEKAVVTLARRQGRDPHEALEQSRALRQWASQNGHDLRLSYRAAAGVIRSGKAPRRARPDEAG